MCVFAVQDAAVPFVFAPKRKVRNAMVSNATVTKVSDCDVRNPSLKPLV